MPQQMTDDVQDTVVAIRKAGDQLVVTNIKSSEYPDYTFSVDPSQACGTWSAAEGRRLLPQLLHKLTSCLSAESGR